MTNRSVLLWSSLGFLLLGGGFGVGAVMALRPPPPPPFAATPEPLEAKPQGTLVYIPLEDQLAVAVAEQPVRVMLTLGVSVRGDMEQLLKLQETVKAKKPAIKAALLDVAQREVAKTADPATLMKVLPAQLRKAANTVIGTAEMPEPVEEVLIVGLVTQ